MLYVPIVVTFTLLFFLPTVARLISNTLMTISIDVYLTKKHLKADFYRSFGMTLQSVKVLSCPH